MKNADYIITQYCAGNLPESLFNKWESLSKSMPDSGFIHYPQWFQSRLNSYNDILDDIYIVTFELGLELVAIFPIQYTKYRKFGLSLNAWRIYWRGDMGINDFIYKSNSHSQEFVNLLIDYLNGQKLHPWHLIHLQNVPEDSSVFTSLMKSPPPRHIGIYHHDSKHIACKSSYEETVSEISSKFKRNNRRKLRKLEKNGSVYYKMAETQFELETAFEQFVEIESANWKGLNKSALKHDQKQLNFYREIMEGFGKNKQCRIHSLWLNDQPIASQFALAINNTFHLLKIGYNSKYHDVGPGGILLTETIRRFSGDAKIKKINFVTGAKWNDDWAPQIIRVYDHFIYNKNIKGYIAFIFEKVKSILRHIKQKFASNGSKEQK